jgi:hypothetical protein
LLEPQKPADLLPAFFILPYPAGGIKSPSRLDPVWHAAALLRPSMPGINPTDHRTNWPSERRWNMSASPLCIPSQKAIFTHTGKLMLSMNIFQYIAFRQFHIEASE